MRRPVVSGPKDPEIEAALAAGAFTVAVNEYLTVAGYEFHRSENEWRWENEPGFWIHGSPARDLEQVESYLRGDAHDRSKVQWFDGQGFHPVVLDT